jgi:ubiquinone/menaquinone biosynthesis C-methylase UbiE
MNLKKELLAFWDTHDFTKQKKLIAGPVDWDRAEEDGPAHCRLILTKLIKDELPKQPRVLEIGCGVGRLIKVFAGPKYKYSMIGVDLSPGMIEQAKSYLKGLTPLPELYVTSGGIPVDVKDQSVDFIYSFLVFQHIQTKDEVQKYVVDTLRVLKPGGFMRVQTHKGSPSPNGVFGGFHGRFYPTLEEMAEEFSVPGGEVVEQSEGGGHPDWLWVTVRKNK